MLRELEEAGLCLLAAPGAPHDLHESARDQGQHLRVFQRSHLQGNLRDAEKFPVDHLVPRGEPLREFPG